MLLRPCRSAAWRYRFIIDHDPDVKRAAFLHDWLCRATESEIWARNVDIFKRKAGPGFRLRMWHKTSIYLSKHLITYWQNSVLPQYSVILLCSCLQLLWRGITCHAESRAPKCLAILMWPLSPVIWHPRCRYWVCDSELSDSGVHFKRDPHPMRPDRRRYTGQRASYQFVSVHQHRGSRCSNSAADVTQSTSFKGSGLGL